jgi:1L-myo-inositol 1-phosphate cytidylyltransferase
MTTQEKTKAVILAAGQGSRLRELGPSKPLTPLGGTPLIERVIRTAVEGGADGIVVVVGYLGDQVRAFLETLAPRIGVPIEIAENADWRLANGRSILAAAPLIDSPFHILMSDHLFDPEIMRLLRRTPLPAGAGRLATDSNLTSPYVDLDDVTKVLHENGRIQQIGKTIATYNAFDTGVFYVSPALIDMLRASIAEHNDDSLSGGVRKLAASGKMEAVDIGQRDWIDVDDPAAHVLASRLFSHAAE